MTASDRRRAQREPLQYILGETDFMRCKSGEDPVLIPRNDTEVLCEQALLRLRSGSMCSTYAPAPGPSPSA